MCFPVLTSVFDSLFPVPGQPVCVVCGVWRRLSWCLVVTTMTRVAVVVPGSCRLRTHAWDATVLTRLRGTPSLQASTGCVPHVCHTALPLSCCLSLKGAAQCIESHVSSLRAALVFVLVWPCRRHCTTSLLRMPVPWPSFRGTPWKDSRACLAPTQSLLAWWPPSRATLMCVAVGFWLLAADFWLTAAGCWLCGVGMDPFSCVLCV